MGWMADETGLDKRDANFVPLTPLSHLARAAKLWPERDALIYGHRTWSYADYHARVSRLDNPMTLRMSRQHNDRKENVGAVLSRPDKAREV